MLESLRERIFGSRERELADYFPVIEISDGQIILKDGRVAILYEVDPVPSHLLDEAGYINLNNQFESALKSLPVGALVQKIDHYFDKKHMKDESQDSFFRKKFEEKFEGNLVLHQKSYLAVISPTNKLKDYTLLNHPLAKSNLIFNNAFEGIAVRKAQAEEYATIVSDALRNIEELEVKRVSKGSDIAKVLYDYVNYDISNEELKEPTSEITNNGNSLSIGHRKLNVVSLASQASEILDCSVDYFGVLCGITENLGYGLQFPHTVVTTIRIEDTQRILVKIEREAQEARNMRFRESSIQGDQRSDELVNYVYSVQESNNAIVSLQLSVFIESTEESTKNINEVESLIRSLPGARPVVENKDLLATFLSNVPGAAGFNYRFLKTTDNVAARYFNWCGNKKILEEGEIYMCDRYHNPITIKLFDYKKPNNVILIGPTGSGKSFTIGHVVISRREVEDRQFIIDCGKPEGSYRNLVETLNGVYMEYSPEKPFETNPFMVSRITDEDGKENWNITSDKLVFLNTLLGLLWKNGKLDKGEESDFLELLPLYYSQEADIPRLDRFCAWLRSEVDRHEEDKNYRRELYEHLFDAGDFLKKLRPFTKTDGLYYKVLNGDLQRNVVENPLICFDLGKVKDNGTLYPIVTLILFELISDMITLYPEVNKHIYADEAWAFMNDDMGAVIEVLNRTIRKSNGGMWTISQTVDEFTKSDAGSATIKNARTSIVLYHENRNELKNVQFVLGLTNNDLILVESLKRNRNNREIFIKNDAGAVVVNLNPTIAEYSVVTSVASERLMMRELMQNYLTLEGAINSFEEKTTDGLD